MEFASTSRKMTDEKLSGNGKRLAKLTWTHDMRLTLDALTHIEDLTWATRAAVFNTIYHDQIKKCGYIDALPYTTLRSQCSAAEKAKNKDWIEISSPHQTAEELVKRRSLRTQVEATLAALSGGDGDGECTALPQGPRNRRTTTPTPVRHVPLSEQSPVAYWDPYTTPWKEAQTPRQPKRSRALPAAGHADLSEDGTDDGIPRLKRRRLVISSPNIVQRSELNLERTHAPQPGPSTPSRALSSPRTPGRVSRKYLPKRPYPRPEDTILGSPPLQLTEREHDRTQEPMIPVTKEHAHPPMPALCYRYWPAEAGQLRNRETGFIARKFARCVPMYQPPPRAENVCWTDIWDHINRNEVPTPFVSVSTALWWILRLALKEAQKGVSNGMISVIDTTRIDQRAIFHAPPYHAQTKKKYVYRDGAQRYPGTHEHLVWREIPGEAMVKTLKVSDILRFATANPIVAQALSFDLLPRRGAYEKTILPALRARNIKLTSAIIAGMAKLVDLLGIDPSEMNQLSHVVSDVIQGWAIQLPRLTSPEWAQHATTFDHHVSQISGSQLSLHSQETKLGFLDGVRWGCSKHWNTRHSSELMRLMQKQAKLVGVDDPVKILTDELDAAKLRLKMLGARQTRGLPSSLGHQRGLGSEDDDGASAGSDDEIVYE